MQVGDVARYGHAVKERCYYDERQEGRYVVGGAFRFRVAFPVPLVSNT